MMYKLSASNENSVNEAKFSLFIINTIALCWQRHYLARQAEQFFKPASHGATTQLWASYLYTHTVGWKFCNPFCMFILFAATTYSKGGDQFLPTLYFAADSPVNTFPICVV